MHVHSRDIDGIPGGPRPPEGQGWRVEVNLRRGQWRWVRRYGNRRQWTAYRPLAELPPERIAAARAESAKQQALRINNTTSRSCVNMVTK
jgi:hypothetical protein